MMPCIMIQTLKVGATVFCKILVMSYKITLCDIPYDRNCEVSLCLKLRHSRCVRYNKKGQVVESNTN